MADNGRNVHQRKLAVMRRLDGLGPDKVYDGVSKKTGARVRFPYISIQAVSNGLRKAAVEEGLDILVQPQPSAGTITIELVNVDDPEDRIVSEWPLVPEDRAWAYSAKYALVRLFLIGDAEEGDEAELAEGSAGMVAQATPAPARQAVVAAPAPKQQSEALKQESAASVVCPKCGSGQAVRRYSSPRDGKAWFCAAGSGGCGHSFEEPVSRADFLARQQAAEEPASGGLPQLTEAQRARLRALNESLPELLQLTPEERRKLLAEGGFERAEQELLKLHEHVRAAETTSAGVVQ